MFANRLRVAVAGTALALTTPLLAVSTAAAPEAAAAQAAKEERTITVVGKEPKDGVFFINGKVEPKYPERFAILQRKLKGQQKWRNERKFRTNDRSRFHERIHPLKKTGTVCYRVRVKGTDTFKAATSARVCIRTFRT